MTEPPSIATGPEPADTAPVPPPQPRPPAIRDVLGRALDANVAAAGQIRTTSLMVGALTLVIVGPVILLHAIFIARIDDLQRLSFTIDRIQLLEVLRAASNTIDFTTFYAIALLLIVAVDCQLLSLELIAARALGRRLSVRAALAFARRRFWPLVFADLLVGLILLIPRAVLNGLIAPRGVTLEAQAILVALIGVVLTTPFAYVATWVLLGGVGPRAAVGRSWAMVRARPALGLMVAIVNGAVQVIALFAAGAGIGLLATIGQVLGIHDPAGIGVVPEAIVIAALVVAAGSLFFTMSALAAGPQVVAYLALGGKIPPAEKPAASVDSPATDPATAGGPVAHATARVRSPVGWSGGPVTVPMLLAIGLEILIVVTVIQEIR